MKENLGAEDTFDIPGLTELYGPGTGLECGAHDGITTGPITTSWRSSDPETLKPAAPGETGEMVVTTLRKEAAPLIRYRTRDLTRLLPGRCACGSILPRHDKILGRSDDMFHHPGRQHLSRPNRPPPFQERGVGSEFSVILERGRDGKITWP